MVSPVFVVWHQHLPAGESLGGRLKLQAELGYAELGYAKMAGDGARFFRSLKMVDRTG
ncbi:hypothetical protein Btus_2253 [Kyrpidia tusciae DSM 2912]|uniref:Uncharacterized protein n=1 Tax=Kyrpidia tusciae (strain DSM 2912 / NBRC 15312 / T2) TaxID=562970 RepID=D5WRX3_KYRT2|nr:hypothetical protein Btus_2253 [Kyrpidia tusciae DSM 2912]